MQLFYRLAADAVVIFHFSIVAFIIFGLLLTLIGCVRRWAWVRNVWFRGLHLLGILIIVGESWIGFTCPFTTWEKQLRALAGEETYQGDFLANCVHDMLFYTGPPWVFTLCYSLFGLAVALTFIFAPPRLKPTTVAKQSDESATE